MRSGPAPSARSATRPKLAFLGLGWIGLQRMESVLKADLAEIVAVADAAPRVAAEAANRIPGAQAAATLEELLATEPDGIVIATPNALHAEQAIAAFEGGSAVFCQKPLACSARDAGNVIDAALRADRLLDVDLSYRGTRAMQQVYNLIRSGVLGEIFLVNLAFHNAYGPDKAWFYDRRLSGGGCLIDLGIHLVDLALWALGDPVVAEAKGKLFARGNRLAPNPREIEDFATATIELSSGAVIGLSCSWHAHAGCDCTIAAEFYGTEGGAAFRNVDGSFYNFRADHFTSTTRQSLSDPPDDWCGRRILGWTEKMAIDPRFDADAIRFGEIARIIDMLYGR